MERSDINLNLYKTFYEVAKSGSISAASKHLYVSQPATSRAIKKLEEQLNITLFYRNLNGMELTHKGKELLFYIEVPSWKSQERDPWNHCFSHGQHSEKERQQGFII